MKKITKAEGRKFNEAVVKMLLSHGYSQNVNEFEKETPIGKVKFTTYPQTGSEIYSIFCRFEDVEKARKHFSCNQYTGKHNFHDKDSQVCFGMFEWTLDYLKNRIS